MLFRMRAFSHQWQNHITLVFCSHVWFVASMLFLASSANQSLLREIGWDKNHSLQVTSHDASTFGGLCNQLWLKAASGGETVHVHWFTTEWPPSHCVSDLCQTFLVIISYGMETNHKKVMGLICGKTSMYEIAHHSSHTDGCSFVAGSL